jgi:methionine-S-sulfoxide reductase
VKTLHINLFLKALLLAVSFNAFAAMNIEKKKLFKTKKENKEVIETALLAGGCFWGVEELIRKLDGVVDTQAGYTGGNLDKPTYNDVHTGKTGHAEAVQIKFNPKKISYEAILKYFFRLHDPTTLNQQGNDKGTQYRSAIFYESPEQQAVAIKVKAEVEKSHKWKKPIVTEITKASTFYPAEEEHQDYLQKNPNGYTCHYLRD